MKVKIEIDMTSEEAKEIVTPSEKQTELMNRMTKEFWRKANDEYRKMSSTFNPLAYWTGPKEMLDE